MKKRKRTLGMLAIALGCELRCREDIDKIYNTNPKKYFNAYQNSGILETNSFDKFSVTTSEYIKKCFGIILYDVENDKTLNIMRLIKKGYKPALTYYTHASHPVLELFTQWYNDKLGGLEHISGIYLDYCYFVLIYLSEGTNKEVMKTPVWETVSNHFYTIVASPSIDDTDALLGNNEISFKGYESLIDYISFKGKLGDDVSMIFENIRLSEELPFMDNPFVDHTNIAEHIARSPKSRITNSLMIMMEILGVSSNILREVKISNERLHTIAKYSKALSNTNSMTPRELEVFYLTSLILYSLATEYNNLRNVHYENAKTTIIKNEIEQERVHLEEKEKQDNEIAKLRQQLAESQEKINKLTTESIAQTKATKSLELENKRLVQEVTKAHENDKELQFLRTFYFDEINNTEDSYQSEEETVNTLTTKLKSVKGVIVGGHPNFQNKLKETLPSFVFLHTDDLGRNLSFIRNSDIVFFKSSNNNHGLFYKVMKEVNSSDVPITYLDKTQSVEITLKDIHNKLIKEGISSYKE